MKSVKPGRGPSFMGGIGAVVAIVFGIIWTIAAASMGAPVFFPLFGVIFIIVGIVQAVYNFKNATSKQRYSAFDITDDREEPDPLNERFGNSYSEQPASAADGDANFCPYCGAKVNPDHKYCKHCGKEI